MDKYLKNIKLLIEDSLVKIKVNELKNNCNTLITYHNIGKQIVESQKGHRTTYGKGLLKKYAIELENEFGHKYNIDNLKRYRQFYLLFPKGDALRHQLSWTHYRIILPIKNEAKRNYYINSVVEHNFSSRELKNYIKTKAYERLLNKENIHLKYGNNSYEEIHILDMIKNPILISINESIDKITEKTLRKFMLNQIEKTMLELGVGFAYVGAEIPIKISNKILKPDLVFFNTELACYVILELKIKELNIRDIGQIEFYVKYYDSYVKKPFYNETVGIIISKKANENIVKLNSKPNIKHSTYQLIEKD